MQRPELYYAKTRNVKDPEVGTDLSAGIDFFVPEITEQFKNDIKGNPFVIFDNDSFYLEPEANIVIPTGIKMDLQHLRSQLHLLLGSIGQFPSQFGISLMAKNKSGISTKWGLVKGAELIDEDYQGELHIHLIYNVLGNKAFDNGEDNRVIKFKEGDKLMQFVPTPVIYTELKETDESDLFKDSESQRGDGGFGSTDK